MTSNIAPAMAQTVPPLRLEPAYSDRDEVWRVLVEHAPYPLMAAGAGYDEMMKWAPIEPWFRTSWAVGGKSCDASIQVMLDDQRFIAAAGRLFGAEVVRPQSLTVNVMGPMDAGHRHVDVPTYRGFSPAKTPIWLPMMMGVSGLFDRWAVRVAGVLTWFYEGTDGEYEYWPSGIDSPSESVTGPFGNVALVGDNDLMFHQVGAIGQAQQFRDSVKLTMQSVIRPGDDGWEIADGATVIGRLPREEVRISLLWRAVTFRDEREARAYDEHADDLDLDTVVSIFGKDLTARGVPFTLPEGPLNDEAWSALLARTYLINAFT